MRTWRASASDAPSRTSLASTYDVVESYGRRRMLDVFRSHQLLRVDGAESSILTSLSPADATELLPPRARVTRVGAGFSFCVLLVDGGGGANVAAAVAASTASSTEVH